MSKNISLGLLFLLALVLSGCGNPQIANKTGEDSVERDMREISIVAEDGGEVVIKSAGGDMIKVIFPSQSIAENSTIEYGVLDKREDGLSAGFSLNKKGEDGLELQFPAILVFNIDKDLDELASIVRYKDDGSYEVIPTDVKTGDGKTSLVAQVMHFSDYGTMKISQEDRDAARQSYDDMEKFNWVIYVNDSVDVNIPPMQRKVFLDFKAVNTSGNIFGTYNGYAHAKTTNDMEAMGGRIDADFSVNDENVTFQVDPYIQLSPLVPEDEEGLPLAPLVPGGDEDLPLAKLEPEQEPDFAANGVLNMRGAGTGTVTAGGYSASRGLEATQSTDSFYMVVVGPRVRLTVNVAGTPTMYFDGYIRGEGK
jgi:hypothetical protein